VMFVVTVDAVKWPTKQRGKIMGTNSYTRVLRVKTKGKQAISLSEGLSLSFSLST